MSILLALAMTAGMVDKTTILHVETIVEAPGPSGPLQGTMIPADKAGAPVVLIIPGSGPTDRDGNNPLGVKAGTYKLLAQGLAGRGIASVRIDKRGMFGSAGAVPDANAVTIPDYVADVGSWVGTIRKKSGAGCVWLLGHSEGALVALAAASEVRDVCGLLLVAAPGRPVGDVLREQLRGNPANAPVLDEALAAIDKLEAGKPVDPSGMHPGLMPLFAPQIQKFMMSLMSYDPAKLAGAYAKPILILHGQRDIQVGERDARRLAEAAKQARLVILPDTNHALKMVTSDDRRANMAAYADTSLPLAPGVVDAIANFVFSSVRTP